ncbi:MAG: response regulator, partial [Anaerolineae bacterium]
GGPMDNHASVLVVDDDEAILAMLRDTLHENYEVATASDVLEAADFLREQNFDLLILDLNMPVVDGQDLMEVFSVHPHFEALPILVISAFPDLIERVKNARVNAILPKPFSIDDLRRTVAHLIEQSRGLPPTTPPAAQP